MTSEAIKFLYNNDPFPNKTEIPVEDIESLYVPFDSFGFQIEGKIIRDLKRSSDWKFYGIIGESGYGKSSVLNYLLSKLVKDSNEIFCVKLNGFIGEINNDPKNLLTQILHRIHTVMVEFNKLKEREKNRARLLLANEYEFTSEDRRKAKSELNVCFNVIPMVLGLTGKIGGDIESHTSVVTKGSKTLDELIDFLNQLVGILQKNGTKRVIIMFDETDRITSPDTGNTSVKQATVFFNTMLPVLRKMKFSYIFVLNSQYNSKIFRKNILDKYFDELIGLPKLKKKNIRKIIEKRTQTVCGKMAVEKIWDEEALTELENYYEKTDLRKLTNACRYAIEKAWFNASTSISIFHVKDAISEIQ